MKEKRSRRRKQQVQRPRGGTVQACAQGLGQRAWSRLTQGKQEVERDGWEEAGLQTFVSASEEDGSHGGCEVEKGYSMTFNLATRLLAACGEWIAGGWGAGTADQEAGTVTQAEASGLLPQL